MGCRQDVRLLRSRSPLSTGQPWLGHVVKRQCGVLLIAAEGADEVRLRLDAVVRSGRQGQEHPFVLRMVEAPDKDEDGDPITTMVIDWLPAGTAAAEAQSGPDTWAQPRRQDQRTAVLRLKRVLMTILAEQGVDLPISPDGPTVRMVDQERVRKAFYAGTPADGTPKQKRQFRYAQFKRALDWAEQERLIAIGEIGDITYIWLTRPDPEDAEEEQG